MLMWPPLKLMTSRIGPCLVSWRGVDGASEDFVANDQEEAMPVKRSIPDLIFLLIMMK